MKILISLFLLSCAFASHSQEDFKYKLLFHPMAEKAKMVSDPEVKALIAKQLYDFYLAYGQDNFQSLHYVYPTVYSAYKSLLRDEIDQKNPNKGLEYAAIKGDSTFNQYHGHMPDRWNSPVDVSSVVWSESKKHFYSAGSDGRILRWNAETRQYSVIYKSEDVRGIYDFNEEANVMAIATNHSEILLLDLNDLKAGPKRIEGHVGATYDFAFLPDGSRYVSLGADKKVIYSDFSTHTTIAKVSGIVKTLDVSPDGGTIAIGSNNGEIILIPVDNPADQRQIFMMGMESRPVHDIRFSGDGKLLGFGGRNVKTNFGYIRIWDLENRRPYGSEMHGFTAPITEVNFDRKNKLIIGASNDQTVRIWHLDQSNDLPIILDDHRDWVFDIEVDPDNQYIYTASADGLIRKFPLDIREIADQLGAMLDRSMTDEEWRTYVGDPSVYIRETEMKGE